MGTEKVGECSARPLSIFHNLRPLTFRSVCSGALYAPAGDWPWRSVCAGLLYRRPDLWACGSSFSKLRHLCGTPGRV